VPDLSSPAAHPELTLPAMSTLMRSKSTQALPHPPENSEEAKNISTIKIDVEGAELEVLEGLQKTLFVRQRLYF
jgi:FkbM family methyltransferase